MLSRKGARLELPADLEHALGTSKEAASRHAGRFAALCGAEETATGHINAAEQATSAAERLQLARKEVTQRIDPKATPALERAVNAEKEIAGLIQTADEARRAAELEAEEAQRQAGSALAPFTSRDDAVAARSTIDEVRRAARDLEARTERLVGCQRELDAPEATQMLVDAEQQAKQARELAEAKRAVAQRAKEEVRGAQERFRQTSEVVETLDRGVVGSRRAVESTTRALQTAIEANALATVAGSCQPGDDCPVCERPLPDDFAAPTDPQIDRARRELADAEEGLRDLEGQLERAKALRDEAALELTTAREAHEATADEAGIADRQATEAESDHSGLVKADESLRGELGREEEALGRERARCQELLDGIPGDLQLTVTDDAAVSEALAQIEDCLTQAQAAAERADDARRRAQQERSRAEEAQGRRQHEVTRPAAESRQTATLLADRVHSTNELLEDTEPVPEAPAADAGVANLARWVALLQAAAGMALVKAQAAADEATAVAAAEQAAADAACHGVGVENFQDLKQAVLTAKGEAEVAAEEVRRLEGDIARAAQLDRFLEIGEPFVANLETLRVTLTDGQFVRALVAE